MCHHIVQCSISDAKAQAQAPFRDGYQTALYLATRHSVQPALKIAPPRPKMYQIGRTRAIELGNPSTSLNWKQSAWFVFIPSVITFLLLFIFGGYPRLRNLLLGNASQSHEKGEPRPIAIELKRVDRKMHLRWILVAVLTYATVIGCFIMAAKTVHKPDAEPLLFDQGVSAWPTMMIRIFCIGLTCIFFVVAWYRHKAHRLRLWQHFFAEAVDFNTSRLHDKIKKQGFSWCMFWNRRGEISIEEWTAPLETSIEVEHFPDCPSFLARIVSGEKHPPTEWLFAKLHQIIPDLPPRDQKSVISVELQRKIIAGIQSLIFDTNLQFYSEAAFSSVPLRNDTIEKKSRYLDGEKRFLSELNRLVLEDAYPECFPRAHKVSAVEVFYGYVNRAQLWPRISRAFPVGIVYGAVAFSTVVFFGLPSPPYRNSEVLGFITERGLDMGTLIPSIILYCLLSFYVVDAVRMSRRMLTHLAEGETKWPDLILNAKAEERHLAPEHLDGYLDVHFAAYQTTEVYQAIFYPAIVLLLMLFARSQLFDNWTWPPALVSVFVISAAIIIVTALAIRRAARSVRELAIGKLNRLLQQHSGQSFSWTVERSSRTTRDYGAKILLAIEEIKDIRTGAYAPFIQDLSLIAALLPTGGYGLLTLLHSLLG